MELLPVRCTTQNDVCGMVRFAIPIASWADHIVAVFARSYPCHVRMHAYGRSSNKRHLRLGGGVHNMCVCLRVGESRQLQQFGWSNLRREQKDIIEMCRKTYQKRFRGKIMWNLWSSLQVNTISYHTPLLINTYCVERWSAPDGSSCLYTS